VVNESDNHSVLREGVAWRQGDTSKLVRLNVRGASLAAHLRHHLKEINFWCAPDIKVDYWLEYDDPRSKVCHTYSILELGGDHYGRGQFPHRDKYPANYDPAAIG